MDDRLYRSRDDRFLAGVAGGLADHYDLDPSLVRVAWAVVAVLSGGLGILVYIVMAIVVPLEPRLMRSAAEAAGTGPGPAGAGTSANAANAADPAAAGGTPPPADPAATGGTPPSAGGPPPAVAPPAGWDWPDVATRRAARQAERESRREARRARRANGESWGGIAFGVILILIGGWALLRRVIPQFDFDLIWPLALVALGVVLVVGALRGGRPNAS